MSRRYSLLRELLDRGLDNSYIVDLFTPPSRFLHPSVGKVRIRGVREVFTSDANKIHVWDTLTINFTIYLEIKYCVLRPLQRFGSFPDSYSRAAYH